MDNQVFDTEGLYRQQMAAQYSAMAVHNRSECLRLAASVLGDSAGPDEVIAAAEKFHQWVHAPTNGSATTTHSLFGANAAFGRPS